MAIEDLLEYIESIGITTNGTMNGLGFRTEKFAFGFAHQGPTLWLTISGIDNKFLYFMGIVEAGDAFSMIEFLRIAEDDFE